VTRILLTGATGFIGSQALRLLAQQGHEVHAVSSAPPENADGASIHWHRADLLEDGAVRVVEEVEPEQLLHFAWYAVPGQFWEAPENLDWVAASLRLLRAFAAAGGSRAVVAGSCAEYDWSDGRCVEAETPLRPSTLYGSCKHALQSVGAAFAREAGFSFAWGRIFFVYGPHEHPDRLVAGVVRSLLAGEPAACSSGRQERDFLHAEDVASAFASLLASGVEGPVNIASGHVASVREVVETIGDLTGRPELIRLGELPDRPGDPPLLIADVGRLRDEVGWTPALSLREGLERTVDWWRGRA
jgi:nucleoside-diphosphate-sugar epimerase